MGQILDFSTANSQITDEIINVSDSNPVSLGHSAFYNKTGKKVVISTAAGGGGTVLTETTDWTSGGAYTDSDLPVSITPDVAYSNIAIVNATYHSTDLYVSYYPLGDNINADLWNNQIIPPFFGSGPYDISATDVTIDLTILNSLPAGTVQIVAAYDGDGSNSLSFTDNGETINNVTVADWAIEGTGELWLMKRSDGNFWTVNPGEIWDVDGGNFADSGDTQYFQKKLDGSTSLDYYGTKDNGSTAAQTFNLPFTVAVVKSCTGELNNTAQYYRFLSTLISGTSASSFSSNVFDAISGNLDSGSYTITVHIEGKWTTSTPNKTAT